MKLRTLLTATALATLLPYTSVLADSDAGAYLAARQADKNHDYQAAAGYFSQSLTTDPQNPYLLENALVAYVGLGNFDQAETVAKTMVELEFRSQLAHLVLNVQNAKRGDWDQILADLEAGREVGPLIDALSQAWAQVGKGQMSVALDAFDTVMSEAGLTAYGQLHKAYALGSVGDFEGANQLFAGGPSGGLRYSARSAIAHAQILSQLGETDSAVAVVDGVFGQSQDQQVIALRAKLTAGSPVPFTYGATAQAGLAEAYLAVAQAVQGEASDELAMIYARAAAVLDETNTDAILSAATLLERLGQYDLANASFRSVPDDSPAYQMAEMGRANALSQAGKIDAAIEVLEALQVQKPLFARGHASLGDTFRAADRYDDAISAYTKALDIYPDTDPIKWLIYYTRGIAFHLTDNWPAAEADFRASLALEPEKPNVLNYLGYSLVERGENMDEALDMIERAVAAQPQNGAIVDSLGWVLYQRGRYQEAVGHLETAASLLAVDPIINDHLGDAYWAVGREVEAYFQWNRALSLDPTETDGARIRRKLGIGLDAVLIEEGAEPLKAVDGDN